MTVDLPSVPVTPMTVRRSEGRSNQASAASARARLRSVDDELRDLNPGDLALDDEADGAGLDRRRREVVTVDVDAGHREEERARPDPARVVGEARHLADRECR